LGSTWIIAAHEFAQFMSRSIVVQTALCIDRQLAQSDQFSDDPGHWTPILLLKQMTQPFCIVGQRTAG